MVNNFMTFSDLMEAEHFDLVIGDEAWDVDYYYHENPELKGQPFVFLTDFVGSFRWRATPREHSCVRTATPTTWSMWAASHTSVTRLYSLATPMMS